MNIYISAPITGRTDEDNELVFAYTKTQLAYYGHFVIDPWSISRHLPRLTHEQYMAIDKEIIKNAADAVFFAPGWKSSKGCNIEHELALSLGLPVYYDISQIAKEAENDA